MDCHTSRGSSRGGAGAAEARDGLPRSIETGEALGFSTVVSTDCLKEYAIKPYG